jgi:hypothetical protein
MIGLDTNVLARYYIDDNTDVEAKRQRPPSCNSPAPITNLCLPPDALRPDETD